MSDLEAASADDVPDVDWLTWLQGDDTEQRLAAIRALGDVGAGDALRRLRERLRALHEQYQALVVAIGKLKRKLEVK